MYVRYRAMIRCGRHFSVVRFGDGEVQLMRNKQYVGEAFAPGCPHHKSGSFGKLNGCNNSKVPKWKFTPGRPGAQRLVELLYDIIGHARIRFAGKYQSCMVLGTAGSS